MVSRRLYFALCRCHRVVMRSGKDPDLLKEIGDWLDENLDSIEDEKQQPEHISSILERCILDL